MQTSMTYGGITANRLTDYDVIHATQKEPQTLKVTDHLKWFCHKRLTNDDDWCIIRKKGVRRWLSINKVLNMARLFIF